MAQTLQTLSIISFAIAGVCLLLAIFFWFFFKIPTVVGDLSGRTARKSIAKMRATNEKTGIKTYRESQTNRDRGKVTSAIPNSGGLNRSGPIQPQTVIPQDNKLETGLLSDNKAVAFETEETAMLGEETAPLDTEATTQLVDNAVANRPSYVPQLRKGGRKIELLEEVMLIHTNEVI